MNKNAKPNYKFPKGDQGLNEAKSQGQIRRSQEKNILAHIRSNLQDRNIISKVFDVVEEEVENGNTKNAIELMKIAKESEDKNINLNGGIEVQKVFIEAKEKQKTDKHIDEFINGN